MPGPESPTQMFQPAPVLLEDIVNKVTKAVGLD